MNSSNQANHSLCEKCDIAESVVVQLPLLFTLIIIGVCGICGNIFVIILAVKYTTRKSLHNLVINMAVSDTFLVLTNILNYSSFFLPKETVSTQTKRAFDIAATFIFPIWVFETLITLLIISVERYRVTKSVIIPQPPSRGRGLAVIAGSWLVSMALAGAYVAAIQNIILYKSVLFGVGIMYSIMVLLNIITLRRISKPQAIENSLSEQQRQQRRNRIRSAVKMVLYSLLLYTCCFVPLFGYFVFHISLGPVWYMTSGRMNSYIQFFLPIINSTLSPVIYCACLSDFRQAAKNVLCSYNTANQEVNQRYQQRGPETQADNQDTHV